jgi:hypothetical protein
VGRLLSVRGLRGLESKEAEKRRFFALADALSASGDEEERERIKRELARLTFGE